MKHVLGVLAAAVLLCGIVSPIRAEESPYAEFTEELRQFSEALPDDLPPSLRDSLADPDSVGNLTEEIGFAAFRDRIAESLGEALPSAASLLVRLMGILLCCGLLNGYRHALGGTGTSAVWELCSSLCITLCTAECLMTLLRRCGGYMESVTALVNGVTSAACAIAAASGQLNSAAVNRTALMLLYTLFQNLYTFLLLPCVRLSFCFSITAGFPTALRTDALGRCVRRVFTWTLALIGTILSFIIGMQNVLAGSADSFAMRTVKFALGNFIPLVGGAVSEALGTAAGSLRLIRSTCGVVCAAAVLILTLPLILHLILHRAVLVLCQGTAEIIGCDKAGKMLGEMHGILGSMLALIALVSLLFLFVLAMLCGFPASGG